MSGLGSDIASPCKAKRAFTEVVPEIIHNNSDKHSLILIGYVPKDLRVGPGL